MTSIQFTVRLLDCGALQSVSCRMRAAHARSLRRCIAACSLARLLHEWLLALQQFGVITGPCLDARSPGFQFQTQLLFKLTTNLRSSQLFPASACTSSFFPTSCRRSRVYIEVSPCAPAHPHFFRKLPGRTRYILFLHCLGS